MQTICVVGLGYIGLPTSITFALSGFHVLGVDIRAETVEKLRRGELHIEENGLEDALREALDTGSLKFGTTIKSSDAYIITVQTPQRAGAGGSPVSDLSFVRSAARDVAKVLRENQLVILESTVPPKTTLMMRDVLAEESGLSLDKFHVAHCPERVIPGQILKELRENDRVIGADTPVALEAAIRLYEKILTKGHVRTADTITAEMCKLSENTYRDINIAYANELSVICSKLEIDVFKLIELANCHPRVNILKPGVGVGGHCIAVDPWFIHEAFTEDARIIETARHVNDSKPEFVARRVAEAAHGRRVCVMGLAYKPDVDDLRESPSLKLCGLLKEHGLNVRACEPHCSETQINGFENLSLDSIIAGDDFLVMAMGHKIFFEARGDLKDREMYDCIGFLR